MEPLSRKHFEDWREAKVVMNSKYQLSRGAINTYIEGLGEGRGGRSGEEISFSLFSEQNGGWNIHLT